MTRLLLLLALLTLLPSAARAAEDMLVPLFDAQEWQARGNLEAARRSVREAMALAPGDAFPAIRMAQLDAVAGDHQKAAAGLAEVLIQEPDNLLARNWLGLALLAQGRPVEARAAFREVLTRDPANGWAHLGAGAGLLALGRNKEAAPFLAKAQEIARAQEDPQLHIALGQTFLGLGLFANARMELESALELSPRAVAGLELAGRAYMGLGQEHLALNSLRQVLALDPANPKARAALTQAQNRQAAKLFQAGRRDEAAQAWRAALDYTPRDPEALDRLRELARQNRQPSPAGAPSAP